MKIVSFFTDFITVSSNPLYDYIIGVVLLAVSGTLAYKIGGELGFEEMGPNCMGHTCDCCLCRSRIDCAGRDMADFSTVVGMGYNWSRRGRRNNGNCIDKEKSDATE